MSRAAETSIYDCGICLGVPDDAVHQCRSGHLFCAPCLASHYSSRSANSKKCPTCRVALQAAPIRCLSAEQAIAAMHTVCQHCTKDMTRGQLKDHLPSCPKRPVPCSAEACQAIVPSDELRAHEQSCVHVTCAAALGHIEATLRAELRETEDRLREEYRRAVVEEHVMTQFRDCARHPPGPGFRVELVKPDADVWITYNGQRAAPSTVTKKDANAQGYYNRLLCLVPGVEGTSHEGGCYPVLLIYSTAEPHRGYDISAEEAVRRGSKSTSFRMCAPVARLPPFEGPRMQTCYTYVPAGWKRGDGSRLAWGEAQPSADELAAALAAAQNGSVAGSYRYLQCSFCHPNVYPSGKICLSTLDEDKAWHPSMTAAEILLSIQAFLDDPNFLDPAQEEPYLMGKSDRATYELRVREQAARYTSEDFNSLVRTYCRPPIRSGRRNENGTFEPEWTDDGWSRIIIGQGG